MASHRDTSIPVPKITPRRIYSKDDFVSKYGAHIASMLNFIKQNVQNYPYKIDEDLLYHNLVDYVYAHSTNASKGFHFLK